MTDPNEWMDRDCCRLIVGIYAASAAFVGVCLGAIGAVVAIAWWAA